MIEQLIWGVLFVACVGLGIWELSRWRDSDLSALITAPHKRRRGIGLALLLAISGLGYHSAGYNIHGLSKLQSAHLLLIYMSIMLLVVALIGVAYYEWKSTLVEFAAQRKEAIVETVSELPVVPPVEGSANE